MLGSELRFSVLELANFKRLNNFYRTQINAGYARPPACGGRGRELMLVCENQRSSASWINLPGSSTIYERMFDCSDCSLHSRS